MAIRRSAEICPSEIDASPLAPLLNAGWWKPEHGPIFIRVLQRPPLGHIGDLSVEALAFDVSRYFVQIPPVDPAGSCYAVVMFEGDLAPTSTSVSEDVIAAVLLLITRM
jgi:hypothetical protein